jgi:GDPmannose 4,6-dehydratase
MWRILQADHADDFVIATGETNSLKDFVDHSFACFGLDWTEHVLHDDQLMRPNEISWSQGNPNNAYKILGWQASKRMRDVVKILCDAQSSKK